MFESDLLLTGRSNTYPFICTLLEKSLLYISGVLIPPLKNDFLA